MITHTLEQPTRWQREPRLINSVRKQGKNASLFGLAADGGYRVSPVSTQARSKACLQIEPTRLCGPIPRLILEKTQAFDVRPLAVILLCAARTFLPLFA
jgi:hypothetical protein